MIALLAFVLMTQQEPSSRYLADTDPKCIKCHEERPAEVKGSIHELKKVGCVECHGKDEVDPKKKNAVHLKTGGFHKISDRTAEGEKRKHPPAFCGRCHEQEFNQFKTSMHFEDWDTGGKVKGCLSCHEFHKTEPANRRAILESKELGCAKCHKPETKQIAAMKAYVERMDGLERELAKLEDHFHEKTPGLTWTEEMSTRDTHAGWIRNLRVRQHAALYKVFKTLEKDIPEATAKVTPDVQKAEAKERGFARLKVYALAAFLGVMAINLLLARAWCIRRFGGH